MLEAGLLTYLLRSTYFIEAGGAECGMVGAVLGRWFHLVVVAQVEAALGPERDQKLGDVVGVERGGLRRQPRAVTPLASIFRYQCTHACTCVGSRLGRSE